MTLLSATVLLFLVTDPLGNVPFFISALQRVPPERRTHVVVRELLIALAVLVLFLFLGQYAMRVLGLTQPALGVAGGVVLLLIALRMVFPSREHPLEESVDSEPFIVPLAIPYVAGPSAIATVLLLMSRDPARWPEWLAALVIAWLLGAVVLVSGTAFQRFLGRHGLVAIERLMGLILVAIAVQMTMNGVSGFLALHGG
ncbi:MAG TPA: MarC family protein [Nevskiaceae bacterium]|nr:MarC family protein [Nevskiaceae bacterium]